MAMALTADAPGGQDPGQAGRARSRAEGNIFVNIPLTRSEDEGDRSRFHRVHRGRA